MVAGPEQAETSSTYNKVNVFSVSKT